MVDGGYNRIVELDQDGKILSASAEPGQMVLGSVMAIGPDRTIYVADVLNGRFDVFARPAPTNGIAKYIPSGRMFWGRTEPGIELPADRHSLPIEHD